MSFRVVILSARSANLIPCVRALLAKEPDLPPEHVLVVDDGARAGARRQLPGVTWVPGVKPFVFARNANLGIDAAGDADVVLLNDDALLKTRRGLTRLSEAVRARPDVGVCSAGIEGGVGNPRQRPRGRRGIVLQDEDLAFVCVYLTRRVLERVGELDERFVGYGFEDNDFCVRARRAGFALGVWDGCVVDHGGGLPSTFRDRRGFQALFDRNRKLFEEKWSEPERGSEPSARVDLMYLACNRLEFTRETFTTLAAHTDWPLVRRLSVYDDGSVDGTREWLESRLPELPVATRFRRTRFGSPVDAMNDFIRAAKAPVLAKLDNDTMVPHGWLAQSLAVLDRHPELTLLGIEAMYPHDGAPDLERSYTPAEFISGLGLYRRSAFAASVPRSYKKWFGLEEWQTAQGRRLRRGWITPALEVFLLDRIPFAPWRGYSDGYIARGWQREWPKYDPSSTLWQWWRGQPGEGGGDGKPPPPAVAKPRPVEGGGNGKPAAPVVALRKPRFLAALRIKNEAEHIRQVIASVLPLCDRVLVLDDHSTDATVDLCRSFGEPVTVFSSAFEGLDEARDKNHLLGKVLEVGPEWVLWIDGDEVLAADGPEQLRAAAGNGHGCYSLRIAFLWGDARHVRTDGVYRNFRRPSFFRLAGQPAKRLRFAPTGYGGNFHCGNVPQRLASRARNLEVWLEHFGYVTREQRQSKYRWYTTIDPNNQAEDCYRHLAEIRGARFAPGPPRIERWPKVARAAGRSGAARRL